MRHYRITISGCRGIVIADRPYVPRDAARLLLIAASGKIRICRCCCKPGNLIVFPAAPRRVLRGSSDRGHTQPRFGGGTWCASARGARRLHLGDKSSFAEGFVAEVAQNHPEGDVTLRFNLEARPLCEAPLRRSRGGDSRLEQLPDDLTRGRRADRASRLRTCAGRGPDLRRHRTDNIGP